ncbi:uncharacterized protein LOC135265577 [Tribolium castaneum]|uniref:uncharacterized protein LOC135265577 n=1 Tax=Tribolium castaneum TaxID=7070 RepID=UPI0030FE655D
MSLKKPCPTVDGVVNNVKWPSTITSTLSNPPCVDKNKELLYRSCVKGQWGPEPKCFYVQPESIPDCPEGYIQTNNICYTYLNSTFPPKCPSANLLPFKTYIMSVPQDAPIWMPITRDLGNGLGPMQWVELTDFYKTTYSDYTMPQIGSDKNCVLYHQGATTAVSCNETHLAICAYSQDQWTADSVCTRMDDCTQADFFDTTTCVCLVNTTDNSQKKAEFVSPVQNHIYTAIQAGGPCSFGLEKLDNRYVWSNSRQEIGYTFWAPDAVFGDNLTYGAVSANGWVLTQQPLSCALVQADVAAAEPSLFLNYSQEPLNPLIELRIDNYHSVKKIKSEIQFYCFTDSDVEALIYRYDIVGGGEFLDDNTVAFTFEPLSLDPGHYWCEAVKLLDSSVIKSNTLFYEPASYYEFTSTWEVFYSENADPIGAGTVTLITKVFSSLFAHESLYVPRIMKMYNLNTTRKSLLVKIHISSTTTIGSEDENAEHLANEVLHLPSNASNPEGTVLFLDLLSSKNCFAETNGVITWPKVPLGATTFPHEFCFSQSATRVSRDCSGDFISGAQWTPYEACERLDYSTVTSDLLNLMPELNDDTSDSLFNISINYEMFNALDVYLVGEMFHEIALSPHVVENFVKTVNNLLNLGRDVLTESQMKTKAAQKFLDFISWQPSKVDMNIATRNLAFYSLNKKDMVGVSVEGSQTHVQTSHGFKFFDSAIVLSPGLCSQIPEDRKITISLFFQDYFFPTSYNVATPVFGMFVSLEFDKPVQVLYKTGEKTVNETCLRWNNFGDWDETGKARKNGSLLICEFYQSGFYSIIYDSENVTDQLIDVLESNETAAVKINQLSHISEQWEKFKPVDISYAGKILQEVANDDKISLHHLAKFVSNSHKIKKEFLHESQMVDKATDRILQTVDLILQNQKHQVEINTEHFAVLKVDLETTNFTGAVLYHDNRTLIIRVLEGDDFVDYNEDFDSAVLLSPELRQQLASHGKIILTVYSNNVLFNEESNATTSNAILGVILPPVGKYQGPVSIIHKTDENDFDNWCVYWQFSNPSSHWQKDSGSSQASSFLKCDYWHTTHFALLLLPRSDFDDETNDNSTLLDYITSINNILSFASLCCILLTAALFKQWRRNTGNRILLNFVVVLLLQTTVFYLSGSISRFSSYVSCTISGALLHYFTISEFCWMLVIAFLQYRRFVAVLEAPPRFVLLKGCLCGWGVPLIPVLSVLVFDQNSYILDSTEICYPAGLSLFLAVWLPVALIVAINSVLFVIILYNIVRRKTECAGKNNEAMYQLRLAVFLFFMFGLTWVFGMLASLEGGIFFLYLFTMTGTLQGVVLFLFFIVFNANTRRLYVRAFKRFNFNFIVNHMF